jgi:putative transposase
MVCDARATIGHLLVARGRARALASFRRLWCNSSTSTGMVDDGRKYGISKATFFKWRSKYGGASVSDVRPLRELEGENAKLKRMYADLTLENAAIKADVLNRKL